MSRLGTLVSIAVLSVVAVLALGVGTAAASFHGGTSGGTLTSTVVETPVVDISGGEVECPDSALEGVIENSNTHDVVPVIGGCTAFGYPMKVNANGCRFRLDSAQEATLHSCANGGMEVTIAVTGVLKCGMFVPDQTVPVAYENGEDASGVKYLNVAFQSATFTGKVTADSGLCWWPAGTNSLTLSGTFKERSFEDFWWTPGNEYTPEFHSAASSSIEAKAAEATKFTVMVAGKPFEEESCEAPGLTGQFAAASHSVALGELSPGASATGKCVSSVWAAEYDTLSEAGCKYEMTSNGGLAVSGCEGGGLTISMKVPGVARCTLLIPNQSTSGVTYKNHAAGGIVGVRGTVNASLTGEVTLSTGLCQYADHESVGVNMSGLIDFVPSESANEIWFG